MYENGKTPKTVLLIQLRQLGDILLTTPAFRAVKKKWPDCRLLVLTHEMGSLVLEGNPYIDEHITYNEKSGFVSILGVIRKLRREKADLLIDFMFNPRSALFSKLSGVKRRVSFDSRRRWAYNELYPRPQADAYIVQDKLTLLESAEIEPDGNELDLKYLPQDTVLFTNFLQENNLDPNSIRVVLSVTHRRVNRMWELEKYAEISDLLTKHWGAVVIWTWGPGERHVVEQATSHCKERFFISPETRFSELTGLIANCDLFIGNSNGPSHVAVSTGIRSLQLHGHSKATSWCPDTKIHQYIQSSEYGQPGATLSSITVDEVWNKIQNMKPTIVERHKAIREKV